MKARQSYYFARYSTVTVNHLKPHVKFISTVIIYLSLAAILYYPFQKTIRNIDISPFAITTLIWRDTASIVMIYFALLYDKHFKRLLIGKTGILYGLFILFYLFIGFINSNSLGPLILDLESCIALVAGIAMFVLLTKSYRPKLQLIAIIAITNLFVCYGIYIIAIQKGIVLGSDIDRAKNTNISQYIHMAVFLFSIGFAVFGRQNLLWKLLILGLFGANILFVGIWAATRTQTLEILTILVFSGLGLCYKISNGFLITQLSSLQIKRLFPLLIFLGGTLAFFLFLDFVSPILDFLTNTYAYKRFFNPDASTQSSTDIRIEEIKVLLRSLKDLEWLLGRGIGGTFSSPVFTEFDVWFLHIGIFTTLLKGGIILFSFFVFTFYIMFPILFTRALLLPNSFDTGKRTAILTVMPGIFAYIVQISATGGFAYPHIFPLGFLFGAYLYIRKYGLGIFFE